MRERVKKIINLTRVNGNSEEAKEIEAIHRELFGLSIHICMSCPDSLRAAFNRIKVWYEGDK